MTTGRVASRHGILRSRHLWPPQATEQLTCYGKRHWLRSDGYAQVELNGVIRRIFLEWDKGTTHRKKHLSEKFQNYADFFSVQSETASRADLLIFKVTPQRESLIWRFVESAFGVHQAKVEVLTSIDSLLDRLGPLATIWRSSYSTRRVSWPMALPPALDRSAGLGTMKQRGG